MRTAARRAFAVVAVLALAVAAATAFTYADASAKRHTQGAHQAGVAGAAFVEELRVSQQALNGVVGLLGTDPDVSQAVFALFARELLRNDALEALSFTAVVPGDLRAAYEQRRGLQIRDAVAGTLRPAPQRLVHYPITLIGSRAVANPDSFGLDVAADPERRAALEAARDSGTPRASGAVPLLIDRGRGFVVYQPIYRGGVVAQTVAKRRDTILGFAAGIFRFQSTLASLTRQLPSGAQPRIFDGGALVAGAPGRGDSRHDVMIAGRKWTVSVEDPALDGSRVLWTAAIGALLTLLVGVLVFGHARRLSYAESVAAGRLSAEHVSLRQVAVQVATGTPPEELLPVVAEESARLLAADAGIVWRIEGDEAVVAASFGNDELTPGTRMQFAATHPVARACAASSPIMTDGHRSAYLSGSGADAAAPVSVEGVLWGALHVSRRAGPAFAPISKDQIGSFADLVGMAIANANSLAQLDARATTDWLTGLANHRAFHERLTAEVERARRYNRDLSLVVFDLDHFKQVNDRWGHPAGDRVLQSLGDRLGRLARAGDLVARVGGEEFAWLMPETGVTEAWNAAERARRSVVARPFPEVGSLTLSCGVCDLEQAGTAPEIYRLADLALYWAKANGRDVTFRYSPEVGHLLSERARDDQAGRTQRLSSIRVLARAVDARDSTTQRHSERVAALAAKLAEMLGWPAERVRELYDAGLVHDVGKIGVADALLLKPGTLSAEEYAQVKAHAALGGQILSGALSDEQVAWVQAHHERFDGRGYPHGIAQDAIPDGARLLAIADAWDSMVSVGVYRATLDPRDAAGEIARGSGAQFDPEVVTAFLRLWSDGAIQALDTADAPAPDHVID